MLIRRLPVLCAAVMALAAVTPEISMAASKKAACIVSMGTATEVKNVDTWMALLRTQTQGQSVKLGQPLEGYEKRGMDYSSFGGFYQTARFTGLIAGKSEETIAVKADLERNVRRDKFQFGVGNHPERGHVLLEFKINEWEKQTVRLDHVGRINSSGATRTAKYAGTIRHGAATRRIVLSISQHRVASFAPIFRNVDAALRVEPADAEVVSEPVAIKSETIKAYLSDLALNVGPVSAATGAHPGEMIQTSSGSFPMEFFKKLRAGSGQESTLFVEMMPLEKGKSNAEASNSPENSFVEFSYLTSAGNLSQRIRFDFANTSTSGKVRTVNFEAEVKVNGEPVDMTVSIDQARIPNQPTLGWQNIRTRLSVSQK